MVVVGQDTLRQVYEPFLLHARNRARVSSILSLVLSFFLLLSVEKCVIGYIFGLQVYGYLVFNYPLKI